MQDDKIKFIKPRNALEKMGNSGSIYEGSCRGPKATDSFGSRYRHDGQRAAVPLTLYLDLDVICCFFFCGALENFYFFFR